MDILKEPVVDTASDCAYVTLVNDSRYLAGAKVLAQSLRDTGTELPLVVIVSDLPPAAISELMEAGGLVWEAPHVEIDTPAVTHFPSRSKTFTKINAWLLTQFRKCVFLDADVVVEANIDRLFEYPEFSAVGTRDYFNSGVFVLRPSRATYELLVDSARAVATDPTYTDDGEQEMLQRVFRSGFSPLPRGYNYRPYHRRDAVRRAVDRWGWSRRLLRKLGHPRAIYVIHFIGYPKPWEHLLPGHARDPRHYTWTDAQISRVQWSFQLWLDHWKELSYGSGAEQEHVDRTG